MFSIAQLLKRQADVAKQMASTQANGREIAMAIGETTPHRVLNREVLAATRKGGKRVGGKHRERVRSSAFRG
jgi:hypothetical protein